MVFGFEDIPYSYGNFNKTLKIEEYYNDNKYGTCVA